MGIIETWRRLWASRGEMSVKDGVANLFGHRRRRWALEHQRRLHVELRALSEEEFESFAAACRARLERARGVEWVRVNGVSGRIVVSIRKALVGPGEVLAAIEAVERELGLDDRGFDHEGHYPSDKAPMMRKGATIVSDLVAGGLGLALSVGGYRRRSLAAELSAMATLLENAPRLREPLERRLGRDAVETALGSVSAYVQAVGAGPIGPLIDAAFQATRLRALRARGEAWRRVEPGLCGQDRVKETGSATVKPVEAGERPAPLPEGPIEAYADEAWFASLGGFVVGLADTHDLEQATSALFTGLPKAARYGRDGFGAELLRVFSERDVIAIDPGALARLDRLDVVVVEAELLTDEAGEAAPAAEYLVRAAHRAGLEVAVVGAGGGAMEGSGADRLLSVGLGGVVREMQRDGLGVAVISARSLEGLLAADLSVGVPGGGCGAMWGADLVCGEGLAGAVFVMEACGVARKVSQRSVTLAGVGALLGGFVSLSGLARTEPGDVLLAVNAASVTALAAGVASAAALGRRPRVRIEGRTPWHAMGREEVLEAVEGRFEGLSEGEAARRMEPGVEPPGRAERLLRSVGRELVNPLTPVLTGAAAASAVVGSATDASMVGAAVVFNAVVSGVERYHADEAVARLERGEARRVDVLRGGRQYTVDGEELVRGDVIVLEAGDVVPADCRILEAETLEVDESSLTGESLPVAKGEGACRAAAVAERRSMVYEGTSVTAGRARGVVVEHGARTEARRVLGAGGAREERRGGVEARLDELTEMTLPVSMGAGALVLLAGMMRRQDLRELVQVGVGLAVASVPEGLPLLSTVAQMSVARRLAQRGVLVRNPRAVEGLGRVEVICVDKTGTLTKGELKLTGVSDGGGWAELGEEVEQWQRPILAAALRASPRRGGRERLPHATDEAVVAGVRALGVGEGDGRWEQTEVIPFGPGRRYHAARVESDEGAYVAMKGSPEEVISRCARRCVDGGVVKLDEAARAALMARAEEYAGEGMRVLAVAQGPPGGGSSLREAVNGELTFMGLLALSDPVRETSAGAVARLLEAGMEVVMITGDHPSTARRIGRKLGVIDAEHRVLSGEEIEALSEEELDRALAGVRVVARATPLHKVRIVESFQRMGKVVAMTGDGANDAAAIRLADVGVALGQEAGSAAREAADLLLLEPRIETLVDAIAHGRAMWGAVRDAVSVLVGGNLGEIGFVLLASLLSDQPALRARQLLLVNLLTDVVPAMAMATRPVSAEELEALLGSGPEETMGETLDRAIRLRGWVTGGSGAVAWAGAKLLGAGPRKASTTALLALVGAQLAQTLSAGERTRVLVGSSLGGAVILLGVVQVPGMSQFVGCKPLGPICLGLALGSSVGAGVLAKYGGRLWEAERVRDGVDAG